MISGTSTTIPHEVSLATQSFAQHDFRHPDHDNTLKYKYYTIAKSTVYNAFHSYFLSQAYWQRSQLVIVMMMVRILAPSFVAQTISPLLLSSEIMAPRAKCKLVLCYDFKIVFTTPYFGRQRTPLSLIRLIGNLFWSSVTLASSDHI